MNNKLTEQQEKRFDSCIHDGQVYDYEDNEITLLVKDFLADEIARAREENNETMTDREEILLLRIDSKLSHLLRLQRLAFDPVNNDLFRLKKGEEKRYIRE